MKYYYYYFIKEMFSFYINKIYWWLNFCLYPNLSHFQTNIIKIIITKFKLQNLDLNWMNILLGNILKWIII